MGFDTVGSDGVWGGVFECGVFECGVVELDVV